MLGMLILVALIIVGVLAFGCVFCKMAISPKTYSHEAALQRETEKGYLTSANFHDLYQEEVLIQSRLGYTLYGLWFPLEGSRKTVIIVHGISYTLHGSVKYMEVFRKLGFNVLLYDQRNHGKSGGRYTTFGHWEKEDLSRCVDFVLERVPESEWIGTHGESLGGATVLLHAEMDPRVQFVVADCSYDRTIGILKFRLQSEFHIGGALLLPIASLFSKLLTGVSFYDISPLEAVRKTATPTLFIHGLADTFTPCEMSQHLYDAKAQGYKELYLVPGAGHAKAYVTDPETYYLKVETFLEEVLQ